MWYPERGTLSPFPKGGKTLGECVPDSADCICGKKSPGPVGLVSNQGSMYAAPGPFHIIASFYKVNSSWLRLPRKIFCKWLHLCFLI